MPASYRLVNFTLRPAKAVERRMILEACTRLSSFSNLLSFRYIGLGSPFFNDFTLLHRRHGLTHLICIERESQDKDRFLFNRPFDCIDMKWGESKDVLPNLQWAGVPSIVWMDYDDPISSDMLFDVGTILSQIEPGSLVLFTIQATGKSFTSKNMTQLECLQSTLREFIPIDATEKDMNGKLFQRLIRRMLDNEFNRVLSRRNTALPPQNHVQYRQLFNLMYADGVRMTTIGGMVYRADQEQRLANCEFSDLEFVSSGEEPHEIRVPVLTYKEQSALASHLPVGTPGIGFLPSGDIEAYRKLYRYYPTFVETDL